MKKNKNNIGPVVHDFRGNRHHPAACRTQHGVVYGSVERQNNNRDVSISDAWDVALANHGRVDEFHIPTVAEKTKQEVEKVRERQEQRRKSALNLGGF